MSDIKTFISATLGATLGAVGTATQTNETLETISLVITIIGAIVSFIVCPILSWYNKAKKDGKIDSKEAQDLANKVNDGLAKLGETLDEINKEGKE